MKIIVRLNEKLNYNQEIFYLTVILSIIFSLTNNRELAAIFFGAAGAYFIYNRNDDAAYGYKVRDKIRGWFGR